MIRLVALLPSAILIVSCGSGSGAAPATPTARAVTTAPVTTTARTATPVAGGTPCATIPAGVPTRTAVLELANGGVIRLALRPDKAPNTVATFVAKANAHFYDGLTFHRVVANFVVQGGDPTGTGSGGGSQPTELSDLPFCRGSLGIARAGDIKVSNDSQFYICTGECRFLDGQYTNFGQVLTGQDIANAIAVGDKIKTIRIE
ncbi:MAG TPA: peptidylprolyl isomerase [Candidatus Limnocylindria bacterium]|nr:peptidylprolyl isomerase [Candidatus Limnocylindria bacterium]